MSEDSDEMLLTLTADIISAHVSNNTVPIAELGGLIQNVHDTLSRLGSVAAAPEPEADQKPAVSVRSSVKPDAITCLDCGRKLKTLKRHLATDHGMTPAEYRGKWKLPADYPMVAPAYAEARRTMAKKIGLGRKLGEKRKPARRK
ncbi:MucR family transcriptional regulator [Sphingomonas soli]|uniref:MucR family transcriptional regulator n=1 Tax=Sphingomonas soli TaxID=266127 RepID=UPI0008377961|nr:MucR family transcriptional regulator [Sphingomonas soli]